MSHQLASIHSGGMGVQVTLNCCGQNTHATVLASAPSGNPEQYLGLSPLCERTTHGCIDRGASDYWKITLNGLDKDANGLPVLPAGPSSSVADHHLTILVEDTGDAAHRLVLAYTW
jgi:hypothetical protein